MIVKQTFTLATIGHVTRRNPSTLRTHISRGLAVAQGPRSMNSNKPSGKHARFSYFTLMEFTVAYHLQFMGWSLEKAFQLSQCFAHSGDLGKRHLGLPKRVLAVPYHKQHGETIFAVSPVTLRKICIPASRQDFHRLLKLGLESDEVQTVNVSQIFDHVCWRLNLDPRVELDKIYRVEDLS
ncbi:MAG: hypothetical protein QNI90_12885 [Dinoroseobacter sp.]|nr:hypothetical protein [Dinoroseobacter sp.]